MQNTAFLFLLSITISFASAQEVDFPFNYAYPKLTPDITKKIYLSDSPFEGYKQEERQILATQKSRLWKSLKIWHFEEEELVSALFLFNEQNTLKAIHFSSSSLAELMYEGRSATGEDYFEEYGKPLLTYFKKAGWKVQGNPTVFPISLIKKSQTLAIRIDTLVNVAINPEVDQFSGFHYNYPTDHIPSQNKYFRFEITFKD